MTEQIPATIPETAPETVPAPTSEPEKPGRERAATKAVLEEFYRTGVIPAGYRYQPHKPVKLVRVAK